MARTVADVALLLSAIAGPDPRSPIAIDEPGARFAAPLDRDFAGVRVAWSRDLGGLPVDPRVDGRARRAARDVFEALGCVVEDAEPDFAGADEVFKALARLGSSSSRYGDAARAHIATSSRTRSSGTSRQGATLTGPQLGARRARSARRSTSACASSWRRYEFLSCPVTQVPPFDVDTRRTSPRSTACRWRPTSTGCAPATYITVTGRPAISVPCGFTPDGLPVGVQIVGRHHDDWGVLQLAHAFEQATGFWKRRPPLAT